MERLRIAVCHRPPLLLPAPRDLHRRRRLHLPAPLSLPHGSRSSLSSPFADEEEEDSIHFAFFHHHPPPPTTTATMASPPPRSATRTSTSSAEPHSSAPQATPASAPPSRPGRLGGLSLRKCHTGTGAVSATRSPALGNAENLREVLLYDEPTAGLDPIASTVVEDLIRSMHVTGKDALGKPGNIASYVVVTHQHSTIRRAVDRLLFLHEGKIVWEGMTQEFTTSTNPIVQQFASGSLDGPIRYF